MKKSTTSRIILVIIGIIILFLLYYLTTCHKSTPKPQVHNNVVTPTVQTPVATPVQTPVATKSSPPIVKAKVVHLHKAKSKAKVKVKPISLTKPTTPVSAPINTPVINPVAPKPIANIDSPVWHSGFYLGLQAGLMNALSNSHEQLQVAQIGSPTDVFNTNHTSNGFLYGLNAGYIFNLLASNWLPQYRLGFTLWQAIGLNLAGSHTFTYPAFNIYDSYQYQTPVNVLIAGLNSSVDIYHWQHFAPFVGAGVNFARIQTAAFTETMTSPTGAEAWSFGAHTNQVVTYSLEAGMRYQPSRHWELQLSYIYLPLGEIVTGAGNTQVVTTPGITNQLTTNNLLFTINYKF